MPSASTITANDREVAPVAHVFTYAGEDANGVDSFVNNSSDLIAGRERLTVSVRQSAGKHRIKLVLTDPVTVTETVNGVSLPKVARTAYVDLSITFDELSTLQERKNAIGMFYNMLSSSQTALDAVLTNGERFY